MEGSHVPIIKPGKNAELISATHDQSVCSHHDEVAEAVDATRLQEATSHMIPYQFGFRETAIHSTTTAENRKKGLKVWGNQGSGTDVN
ncbi:hypothetical protein AVEN_266332-1 [Araneus ventricosus]|uniref:Uncharacterized protein n=1 Tax=Araneus ventricosus TaxID=182803 RepID=A0A4Y2EUM7_ARAVE|nr:hypothetical protein AVEN_266332-1 [Araneus ventricosus]